MNRRSLGALFWGAVLIFIGALLLARNFGYSFPFWNTIAIYWPVLIIAWGGVKLIDYFRFRHMNPPPRLFSGGEVALLLFVIFAGSAVTLGANMSPVLGGFFGVGELVDLWSITGNNYTFEEHAEAEVPPGAVIEVFNLYGDVEIRPTETNRVILDVRKTVRASDQAEANRLAPTFTFSIRQEADGRIRIQSSRDENADRSQENRGNDRQRFRSSLTLLVPVQASLQVTNRFGGTRLSGINGDHDIRNSFGNVTVRTIGGNANIENRFGAVDIVDVTGNVTISTSFASATARNIQGALSIRGNQNEVDVNGVDGPLTVETSFNDVTVRNARSTIEIRSRHGDIDVALQSAPSADIRVESEFGDIVLQVPGQSSFSFDMHTRFGDIDSDFASANTAEGNGRRERREAGTVGAGGPRITLDARNGSISLERRG